MDIKNLNRILIIRLSSLGDILLTTPLIRSLKSLNESIKIDFLLREEYKDTLLYNPYINELLLYCRNDNQELFSRLKERSYDLCLDLQNNFRSSKISGILKTPVVRFDKKSLDKFLLVNFKINKLKTAPPVPARYAEVLKGFELDNKGLDLFIPQSKLSRLKAEDNYIGICPGSRHFTKMWPERYFAELGNILAKDGFRVVLLGGSSDREICKRLAQSIASSVDLSSNNDLLQTASDMKNCKAVVCNDSGMMHTACAMGRPVVVFFGSTVREFGFTPYKNKNLILENNSLSCRPCSHIGRESCPKKHFKCMLEITPMDAFNRLKSILAN